MKRFAVIGAAGYIAPRHLKAIAETGNILVAACDPHDSVGILDKYNLQARFFKDEVEFEEFLRQVHKSTDIEKIDYLVICSPNDKHLEHCELGLENGCAVICEKPLVVNRQALEGIFAIQAIHTKAIHTILQLRLHPEIRKLYQVASAAPVGMIHDVTLTYITGRGEWYHKSWKGDDRRSGGLAMNIGVHFFDLLAWLFGDERNIEVHARSATRIAGFFRMERANVRWYLSVDHRDLHDSQSSSNVFRLFDVNGVKYSFTGHEDELHVLAYKEILRGAGYTIADVIPAIHIADSVMRLPLTEPVDDNYHPLLKAAK